MEEDLWLLLWLPVGEEDCDGGDEGERKDQMGRYDEFEEKI